MTAKQRRTAVTEAMSTAGLTERQARGFTGFSRSSQRYTACRSPQAALRERLLTLATLRPRWGYRRLRWLLGREGQRVNRKRICRLYRELGLMVRRRKRKRVAVPRRPLVKPTRPNQRWSMDFISDALADGRKFRCLTLGDDFTRQFPAIEHDFSLSGAWVVRVLERVGAVRGFPEGIVWDIGPEFTSQVVDQWAHERRVYLQFIDPGKPIQNAFAESFDGRLRNECLNDNWFVSPLDAQQTIQAQRQDHNTARPHSSLGSLTPGEYAASWSPLTPVD